MSEKSNIEWTDATWNPVRGCVKVSPGCKHCYAETFAERFRGVPGHPYEQGFDLRLVPEKLEEPLHWKKPRRVFVNSMSDLFQDGLPDAYIDRVFAVMALAPQHTFQVLTKRAERMHAYLTSRTAMVAGGFKTFLSSPLAEAARQMSRAAGHPIWPNAPLEFLDNSPVSEGCTPTAGWPLPNVWLGVSVENQQYADERIPWLLQTPAAVRFISAEPLLGPVSLELWLKRIWKGQPVAALDWVIVGGESGPGARPMDLAWARSIVVQCAAAGVACFVKQLGRMPYEGGTSPFTDPTSKLYELDIDKSHGGDMAEWPADLRIRQFPDAQREGRP